MGRPAARDGDLVEAKDMHQVGSARVPLWFGGGLVTGLSPDVRINKKWAATVDSIAVNQLPAHPGSNQGTVVTGSSTVLVNRKPMARRDDEAETCTEEPIRRVGRITHPCSPDVFVGD